jgi:hypothetical protein
LARRVYESLFITVFSSRSDVSLNNTDKQSINGPASAKRAGLVHPLNAVVGLAFYTLAPPSFALDAGPSPQTSSMLAAGATIFGIGFFAQVLRI